MYTQNKTSMKHSNKAFNHISTVEACSIIKNHAESSKRYQGKDIEEDEAENKHPKQGKA